MKWKHLTAAKNRIQPTPSEVFFDRRRFVSSMGLGLLGASTLGGAVRGQEPKKKSASGTPDGAQTPDGRGKVARTPLDVPFERPTVFPARVNPKYASQPAAIPPRRTERSVAAVHNNFYEFLPGTGGPVWEFTEDFEVQPWAVEITGHCNKPQTLDLNDLFAFAHEERLYHFRCVERWAMTVPWSGFPLSKLLARVEPTSRAKYVRFISAKKPEQMPGVRDASYYSFPYFEALRMDEAMNELAMVVTGVYGEPLLKQHGAPVRIVVPWKYGYKNPKSIVRIELVEEQPSTFWQVQPHEYGFLSNINPNIPHPRWSQAQSYWLPDQEPFPTPMFNGYAEAVAKLYPDEPMTPQKALVPGQVAR